MKKKEMRPEEALTRSLFDKAAKKVFYSMSDPNMANRLDVIFKEIYHEMLDQLPKETHYPNGFFDVRCSEPEQPKINLKEVADMLNSFLH